MHCRWCCSVLFGSCHLCAQPPLTVKDATPRLLELTDSFIVLTDVFVSFAPGLEKMLADNGFLCYKKETAWFMLIIILYVYIIDVIKVEKKVGLNVAHSENLLISQCELMFMLHFLLMGRNFAASSHYIKSFTVFFFFLHSDAKERVRTSLKSSDKM